MQALLGQKLSSDINLVAQILILVGLWVGFIFARRKKIATHRRIQTTMVIMNSFLILLIMGTSFYNYVIRGGSTTGTVATLMIVHGSVGLLAELTGIYLIVRMNTSLLPETLRVKNFKLVMRTLLGLWTLIAFGGFAIYYFRYQQLPPSKTSEPAIKFFQAASDMSMHATEMQTALVRNNFITVRRHAEHLINLIEGKNGSEYGDADKDGTVEDPSDGVGSLNYLDQLMVASGQSINSDTQGGKIAAQLDKAIRMVLSDALAVIRSGDLGAAAPSINDAVATANQINNGQNDNVSLLLQTLNLGGSQSISPQPTVSTSGQTVEVTMVNYSFDPKTIQVKQGTTVVFVNQDSVKHTVTSDTNLFNSGDLAPGQSFKFTFDQAGTFPYYCVFHGDKGGVDMAGVVVVTP